MPIEEAMQAVSRALDQNSDIVLPVPKEDFIRLIRLCVEFGALDFEGTEFRQIDGLAMGSPLSPVLACLFMEMLESDYFLKIVGPDTTWLRYVDDILVILSKDTDLKSVLRELNEVHPKIQFTCEEEDGGSIAFLDARIWNRGTRAAFSVYWKPTNKNDLIHFYSSHSSRTKTGVVLGFYLRALRICSEEFIKKRVFLY